MSRNVVTGTFEETGEGEAFAPAVLTLDEPEPGVLYRLNCTTHSGDDVLWRISQ